MNASNKIANYNQLNGYLLFRVNCCIIFLEPIFKAAWNSVSERRGWPSCPFLSVSNLLS